MKPAQPGAGGPLGTGCNWSSEIKGFNTAFKYSNEIQTRMMSNAVEFDGITP